MKKWNYYNDFDPQVCAWARELIKEGLVPDGEVDCRSIADVQPDDLRGFTQCHFFCGILGWSYALRLAGWPDDEPVWTGSCPCQPFSNAGLKLGMSDDRNLWPYFHGLIEKCRPPVVLGEQVEGAVKLGWLDRVACDLENSGYAFGSAILQASAVDAWHKRDRIFFVANSERNEQPRQEPCDGATRRVGRVRQSVSQNRDWESALREFRAVDDGLSYGVAGCDGPRNAIVPQVAATFIRAYVEAIISPLTTCPSPV